MKRRSVATSRRRNAGGAVVQTEPEVPARRAGGDGGIQTHWPSHDLTHMRRALVLAARGQGRVEPNPMVGCVIVRDGRVLGEGYHRRFGGPHAEIEALRACPASPTGATAYVTLEPCCHHGKTGPCTEALAAAGIQRVVAAVQDPHPVVNGRGIAALRRAGVRVDVGPRCAEATALNAPFFKLVRTGRPWVILKWAQSLDGKIATRTGDSRWISEEACRAHAHAVRGRVDGILIGVGTAVRDDPLLTCRAVRPRRIATRIVLDTELRLPRKSRLVRTARAVPTWIFCARSAALSRSRALEKAGCRVSRVRVSRGAVALPEVLDQLGAAQMTNLLVEGGGQVLGRFMDERLADEVHAYVAPMLIGGAAAPGALGGRGCAQIALAARLSPDVRPVRLGRCWLFAGRLGPERKPVE